MFVLNAIKRRLRKGGTAAHLDENSPDFTMPIQAVGKTIKEAFGMVLAPMMKDAGFKKEKLNWRRDAGATIQVLNLQGSQFSSSFYLNLGIYIKEIGDKLKPAESDCHLRIRLNELIYEDVRPAWLKEDEIAGFDVGHKLTESDLAKIGSFLARKRNFVQDYALPVLFYAKNNLDIQMIVQTIAPNYDLWRLAEAPEMQKLWEEMKTT